MLVACKSSCLVMQETGAAGLISPGESNVNQLLTLHRRNRCPRGHQGQVQATVNIAALLFLDYDPWPLPPNIVLFHWRRWVQPKHVVPDPPWYPIPVTWFDEGGVPSVCHALVRASLRSNLNLTQLIWICGEVPWLTSVGNLTSESSACLALWGHLAWSELC